MRKSIVMLGALLAFFLGAITPGAARETGGYYPLQAGLTWQYSMTSDKSGIKKVVIKNLPPQKIDDKTVTPREWNTNGRVVTYFVAEDDSGVYKVAERRPDNPELIKFTPPVYYIKYPISEESTWDIATKMGDRDMQITQTIYSLSDEVKVPAGTFKECLKIKSVGTDISPDKDNSSLSVEAFEWFAPGVGIVKSMATIKKKEKDQTASTEVVSYQLESFKK